MKETEDGTNTNYPGKNSKSKFREVSILEFTRLVTIRLQCSFASVNRRATRGNARPLFPDCKPRFRVTWVTCLPRAHRPPGWTN